MKWYRTRSPRVPNCGPIDAEPDAKVILVAQRNLVQKHPVFLVWLQFNTTYFAHR
jgi:hypothetical protein